MLDFDEAKLGIHSGLWRYCLRSHAWIILWRNWVAHCLLLISCIFNWWNQFAVAKWYWGKETTVMESVGCDFSDEVETQSWAYLHGWCYQKSSLTEALEGRGIRSSCLFQPNQNFPHMPSQQKMKCGEQWRLWWWGCFAPAEGVGGSWVCRFLILPVSFHKSLLVNTPFPKVIYLPVCCWELLDPKELN